MASTEPAVQPETQTAQNGDNLPANFTEWGPYSTTDLQLLMQNIANGNVILYNGIYWASPTYANSIANEVVVYQHDISGDVEVKDRFNFADLDISGLYDENEGSENPGRLQRSSHVVEGSGTGTVPYWHSAGKSSIRR